MFLATMPYCGRMQHNHAQHMTTALDAGNTMLPKRLHFRIPITVPYATDDLAKFERAEGTIFREGAYYRLSSNRLPLDTLYLVVFLFENVHEKAIMWFCAMRKTSQRLSPPRT